ncbi:PIN domain-like protein, partial [Rhodocollybia butyracea]
LTQLFTILCQLSYAPVHCTFVYDGDERPSHKRGTRVITAQPLLYKKSKAAVKAFGFDVVDARGDAEAELAVMNQKGIVDAILTRDGDVFPLGAQCILKVMDSKECTDLKLTVDVYYADVIEEELKLTQGGLILYSLLAGNDVDKGGVDGIGPITALALAQSGLGNSLIADCRPLNSLQRHRYLTNLKIKLSDEVKHNTHGRLQVREPACAQKLLTSDLPSDNALNWFLSPPTSWSGSDPARTFEITPRVHYLPGIAAFCTTHIGWSPEVTLTRCHEKLWRGVIIRILCSVCNSFIDLI